MICYKFPGNLEANRENIAELISDCNLLVIIKENQFLIEEEFGYLTAEEDLDFINIEPIKLYSNFKLVYDEDWSIVIESFDQNLIKTGDSAQNYLEEHKEEYEEATNNQDAKVFMPEENIHALYPTLQNFKFGLTKNRLFAETFNFDYLEDKKVLIEPFSKLTEYSDLYCERLIVLSVENFKRYLSDNFKELNQETLYNDLEPIRKVSNAC